MAVQPFRRITLPGLCLVALTLLAGVARAQDYNDAPEADPPSRAARLAYLKGDVSLQPAGEEEWAPALLNRPLTTGDKLWTERGARVEIQVAQAAIRLDGGTGFSFLNLDDDTVQMRMTAGTIIVDVRDLEDREQIEIDTPNISLSLLRAGSYRVEVNDEGDVTTVKIGEGEAEATGPSTNTLVHSRQVVTFRGYDDLVADTGTLGPPDDFDNWSMDREHRDDRHVSSRYVSRDVTGYHDLDEYGRWSSEPEYGYVWTPTRVVVGWSPYRFGRWVWVSPWGWTWIDDSPWGYAPFHYGRWAHIRNRWCWVPGPRHVRAVYAPALVGWVGSRGTHLSWFPLGPKEVYVPGRRFSRHYVERVNIANAIVNQARIRELYDRRGPAPNYRNRSVPDAITSVPREAFTAAQRTGERRVRLDPRELNVVAPGPQVTPVRESRLGGSARANPRVPRAMADRLVNVKREPPPATARFARRAQPGAEMTQSPPLRGVRPQDRGQNSGRIADGVADHGLPRASQERNDRPDRPRADAQLSPAERRSLPDRVRETREAQLRDEQLQRERIQRDTEDAPRWQRRDDRPDRSDRVPRPESDPAHEQRDSQYPQYSQRPQRTQDAVREAVARQLEQRERQQQQLRERNEYREQSRPEYREQPRERPQMERPREQPRMPQPRQEYRQERRQESPPPRPEPRQEQPRQERQTPAEMRSQRGDGNRPSKH